MFEADVLLIYTIVFVVNCYRCHRGQLSFGKRSFPRAKKLQNVAIISYMFHFFFSFCTGFAWASHNRLKWIIALEQTYFQQERLTLGKLCIGPTKDHPSWTPRVDLICTVPRPHLFGRALIWPGHLRASTFSLFGLYASSLSKSVGLISLAGKASFISIADVSIYQNSE